MAEESQPLGQDRYIMIDISLISCILKLRDQLNEHKRALEPACRQAGITSALYLYPDFRRNIPSDILKFRDWKARMDALPDFRKPIYKVEDGGKLVLIYDKQQMRYSGKWVDTN